MFRTFKDDVVKLIPNLRAFAVSLCGDPVRADDLVQETLVKALDHADAFRRGTNLKAWLFTILRNTYFSEYRQRRREVENTGDWQSETLTALPSQQGHVDLQDFRRLLMDLPDEQREALILVGAVGLSYEEAAAISGCAVGTVKSRVSRARRRLSSLLGVVSPEEFGPDSAAVAIVSRRTASIR